MKDSSGNPNAGTAHYAQGLGGIIASGMWADKPFERNGTSTAFFPPTFPTSRPVRQLSEPFTPLSHSLQNPFACRTEAHVNNSEVTQERVKPAKFVNRPAKSPQVIQPERAESPRESSSESSENSAKADWICVVCGNKNYSWRHVCNMRKCRAPKPGHLTSQPLPPGSWACLNCGNLNYAERTVCNMRKCKAPRPSGDKKVKDHSSEAPVANGEVTRAQSEQNRPAVEMPALPSPDQTVTEYALWGGAREQGFKQGKLRATESLPNLR